MSDLSRLQIAALNFLAENKLLKDEELANLRSFSSWVVPVTKGATQICVRLLAEFTNRGHPKAKCTFGSKFEDVTLLMDIRFDFDQDGKLTGRVSAEYENEAPILMREVSYVRGWGAVAPPRRNFAD